VEHSALLDFSIEPPKENIMNIKTRRIFLGKITAVAALLPRLELFAQQALPKTHLRPAPARMSFVAWVANITP
jgi:hypothetical protein